MFVTTIVNFGRSPTTYCGWFVMPLTASVESGQSSPSLRTGGGVTAAVGVAVGGGAFGGGGCIGVWTSGFSPGSGVGETAAGAADCSALVFTVPPDPAVICTTTITSVATTPITTAA